jgi:hypothetical protein
MFLGSKVRPVRRADSLTPCRLSRQCGTLVQIHYFSENLVAPQIEHGPLDL